MKKIFLLSALAISIVMSLCGMAFAQQPQALSPASSHAVAVIETNGVTFIIHEARCDNSMLTLCIERRPDKADTALIDNQVEYTSADPALLRDFESASEHGSKVLGTLCDVLTLTDENGRNLLGEYMVETRRKGASLIDTFSIILPKESIKQVNAELIFGANEALNALFPQSKTVRLTAVNQESFFSSVAKQTFENGEYENWPLSAKQELIRTMDEHGMLPDDQANELLSGTEAAIDEALLARYGMTSVPADLGAISLIRMATVEMGLYTDWPNETWVWFSQMMLETGLWNERNDVDVYETPGDEAIPPEDAIRIAKQHLLDAGVSADELDRARVIWHYTTQASDIKRKHLTYLLTFRFADGHEQYVFLTPDGQIRS